MSASLWQQCLKQLEGDLTAQQFNTWIRPLHAVEENETLRLLAPNRFVLDWVNERFIPQITGILQRIAGDPPPRVTIEIGSKEKPLTHGAAQSIRVAYPSSTSAASDGGQAGACLRAEFTFENFVEGKSNQLAYAASRQVAENPGLAYNPLFIYGGVGLGKTHLMHAVGHLMLKHNPRQRIVYAHSERFVNGMVKALQHNTINEFKRFHRSVDALLIDDIQFFAGKERSQDEFFHTFNALIEDQHQIIMTCDRYPKVVTGLEERLKSRFGWGLTVSIEPPELETRMAILMSKAAQSHVIVPDDVAFFIAKRIHSNIRELEGALRRVIAYSHFTNNSITLEATREALKDVLALQDKLVSIENIQKTVAEYYKIRAFDMLSKRRSRSISRPRQIAMALAKELTNHSLPEIGSAFGGRDHTTVLHACKKIEELRTTTTRVKEDYVNLLRTLTS